MPDFWKAAAIVLLTVILGGSIGRNEKELAILLNLAACCSVAMIAIKNLAPVMDYLWMINGAMDNPGSFTEILLKVAGIAVGSELVGMISSDAGSSSLAKVMRLLGVSATLSMSLPMFETLFTMIQDIFRVL